MKKTIIILFFLFPMISWSQKANYYVRYSYDKSGNLKLREIKIQSKEELNCNSDTTFSQLDTNKLKEDVLFTEQVLESKINIFPNPTYGQLRVQITNLP